MLQLENPLAIDHFVTAHPAAMLYFSGSDCGVCLALKPRLEALVTREFPLLPVAEVDCGASPASAARYRVFAIPTVLVFFDGREWLRKARQFGIAELAEALARPYALRFER